ncbi:MAG: hypothetical protein K0S43_30 [Cellulosimicrobium sp.]|nr:hypothetical protein [Cellulosimicrobium sp.]
MTSPSATTSNSSAGSPQEAQGNTIQRVHFGPATDAAVGLYVKTAHGDAELSRTSATLPPHGRLTTETYFGRIPAAYLQRWTTARSLQISLTVTGHGLVSVVANGTAPTSRPVEVREVAFDTPTDVVFDVPLDKYLDGGYLWLEAQAGDGSLTLSDVRVIAGSPAQDRPTSVVICTYNRPADCLATLDSLSRDPEVLKVVETVYVVDQGTSRVTDQPGFGDVRSRFGDRLQVIEQRNLGGAGGFTRGLFEITGKKSEEHANVLFMDDDIVLEPETVLRMTAFANHAIRPMIVGGQMLYLYQPTRLHTNAETVNLPALRAGLPVDEKSHDVNLLQRLPRKWMDAGYNAWWSCLIPAEVVREIGFPLPMFFQWDDIEYGVRARQHGIPTTTLPGAGVWHADFSLKDWDDWSRYFSHRNSLITAALHSDAVPADVTKTLAKQFARYIAGHQYGMTATLIKAIDDFLAGPSVLADGGEQALKDVLALRKEYPDTIRRTPEDLADAGLDAVPTVKLEGTPSLPSLVLAKRLAFQALGHTRGAANITAGDSQWWHTAMFRQVVVTDASQDAFRVRTYDSKAARQLSRDASAALWRLRRQGAAARDAWRDALPRLTSRESWERLYSAGD